MAEILIKAIDHTNSDPDKDRRGAYKRGYPVVVMPDNHTWGTEEGLPKFVILKCPEITVAQAKPYIASWEDDAQFQTLAADHDTGQYTVRILNNNASVSGNGNFDRDKVEQWFERHGATFLSAAPNAIDFSVALWQTLQSNGFWERDVSSGIFTLNSYTNPTANVDLDYSAWSGSDVAETVASNVSSKGGSIITNTSNVINFTIDRQDIILDLQESIKRAVDSTYKRRQFYFSEAQVSAIEDNGGTLTVTQAQLVAAVKNFLDE